MVMLAGTTRRVDMWPAGLVDQEGQAWAAGCNGPRRSPQGAGSSLRYCRPAGSGLRPCPASGIPHRRYRWRRSAGHAVRLGGCRAFAQRRVILFFWPMRASSANQISIVSQSSALGVRDFLQAHGKAFLKSSIALCVCAWWRGRAEKFAVAHGAPAPD